MNPHVNLNNMMHPRNPYREKTDFKTLALKYPEFRRHAQQDLSGKVHVDFKNLETLRALTRSLCHHDFKLDVIIPENHLIPTLPLRLNYILWIEDLLALDVSKPSETCGIDIGTGATCIYPLLGCRKNHWKYVATESNDNSFSHAVANVKQNHMENSITVVKTEPNEMLENVVNNGETTYAFCMCNPPFFAESVDEMKPDSTPRIPPTNPGCPSEKVFGGGEKMFVEKIINDSLQLKNKIRIYTTMLGKKASFTELKARLTTLMPPITSISGIKFCQGKTVRYGIAWTFLPDINLEKATPANVKNPRPITVEIAPPVAGLGGHYKIIKEALQEQLRLLQVEFQLMEEYKRRCRFLITAKHNTWIHQRRKRRAQQREQKSSSTGSNQNGHEIKNIPTNMDKRPVDPDEETEAQQAKRFKADNSDHSSPEKCVKDQLPDTGTTDEETICKVANLPSVADKPSSSTAYGAADMNKIALKCELNMSKKGETVVLGLTLIDGCEGHNGMYQLSQYLKKHLTSEVICKDLTEQSFIVNK